MKLLVLAQIPPPLHGQSLMVRTLVEGLPAHGVALQHVNLRLSRSAADIGRWRPGKILTVLAASLRAVSARYRHGCDTLYYVPAPGKRGALYRDLVVMLICRPFFKKLVLHFHNGGLADWLAAHATAPERGLTRWLLGRANLSIVLTPSLRRDAEFLRPLRVEIVPNGIADPCPDWQPRPDKGGPSFQVVFLGLCSDDKGLFDVVKAVLAANRQAGSDSFKLVAAGAFPDSATQALFQAIADLQPGIIRHAGFVVGDAKEELLRSSDCLCMPTRYQHEAQPLVLLEAFARDLPIIATAWRGIPETIPPQAIVIQPGNCLDLARALLLLRNEPPEIGIFRRHYLANYTVEKHIKTLAEILRSKPL